MFSQGREMLRSAIALVPIKTILRVAAPIFHHEPVPVDLRNDTGRGDGEAELISLHEGAMLARKIADGTTVDKGNIGGTGELLESHPHRPPCRPQDVDAVDLVSLDAGGRPVHAVIRE